MSIDMFANQPLFATPDARASFPSPISLALDVMASEMEESGEATTADELSAVIEAALAWLGRLWIAEYLLAVETDDKWVSESRNRDVVERAATSRAVMTGQWVYLARSLREQLSGYDTVVTDLAAIDYGMLGDDTHPIAKLLRFRNHFSHGSFASTVSEIREHRQLLHDLLARVPALYEAPVLCREGETGITRLANGRWNKTDAPANLELPDAQPILLAKDGRTLNLYPLLYVSMQDGNASLKSGGDHPASGLLHRPALAAFMERYEKERQGFLKYSGPDDASVLPSNSVEALRTRLQAPEPGLIVIEAHPGCGGSGAIAALCENDPLQLGLQRYSALGQLQVRDGDVGQSGLSVGRFVLRMVEQALGERPGRRQSDAANLLEESGPLASGLADLKKANKEILIGLLDVHYGITPYRGEPLTVRQVYEFLLDTAATVVVTTMPGAIEKPLYDLRIDVPIPETPQVDEVAHTVRELCAKSHVHLQALQVLAEHAPTQLFTLCDEMEARFGGTVLEPQVERALWDMRPLLLWQREAVEMDGLIENHRVWRLFSPIVSHVLAEVQS